MPNVPWAYKSFWMHPMERLGDMGQVEPRFDPFGDVLVSVQDKCTVCATCTIGSEIILDAPDGTPRRRGSSGISRFGSFGHSANRDTR